MGININGYNEGIRLNRINEYKNDLISNRFNGSVPKKENKKIKNHIRRGHRVACEVFSQHVRVASAIIIIFLIFFYFFFGATFVDNRVLTGAWKVPFHKEFVRVFVPRNQRGTCSRWFL